MNTAKINNVLALFDKYSVHLLNDDVIITMVGKSYVVGESDNEVLYLRWESDDYEFCVKFNEGGLNGAFVVDGILVMEDVEGDRIEIEFQEIKTHHLVGEELI
jgi:hypothetical protein